MKYIRPRPEISHKNDPGTVVDEGVIILIVIKWDFPNASN